VNEIVDNYGLGALQASGIVTLFANAEKAIKLVELTHSELIIPAVNELRYVGYHITNYIKNPEKTEEIDKAVGHCKRATFDAYEAGIIYYIREFQKFKDDYATVMITEVVPKYIEYCKGVIDTIDFINKTDKDTRHKNYIHCAELFDNLSGMLKDLDIARAELNKLLKKERRNSLVAICAILALIVAIVGIFINHNNSPVSKEVHALSPTNSKDPDAKKSKALPPPATNQETSTKQTHN